MQHATDWNAILDDGAKRRKKGSHFVTWPFLHSVEIHTRDDSDQGLDPGTGPDDRGRPGEDAGLHGHLPNKWRVTRSAEGLADFSFSPSALRTLPHKLGKCL